MTSAKTEFRFHPEAAIDLNPSGFALPQSEAALDESAENAST
jgi:hypothetical protein